MKGRSVVNPAAVSAMTTVRHGVPPGMFLWRHAHEAVVLQQYVGLQWRGCGRSYVTQDKVLHEVTAGVVVEVKGLIKTIFTDRTACSLANTWISKVQCFSIKNLQIKLMKTWPWCSIYSITVWWQSRKEVQKSENVEMKKYRKEKVTVGVAKRESLK